MARLSYTTAEGTSVIALREIFTVGRSAGNDLVLAHDKKISHYHARIRHVDDEYIVEDMKSTNGTYLERGLTVTRLTLPQQLQPHDIVRVGSTRLVFELGLPSELPAGTPEDAALPTPPRPADDSGVTAAFGETKQGRYIPLFINPSETPGPATPAPTPTDEQARQRIAELERQVAELTAQLAKKREE